MFDVLNLGDVGFAADARAKKAMKKRLEWHVEQGIHDGTPLRATEPDFSGMSRNSRESLRQDPTSGSYD
jgi:hypothetical protein